MVGWIWENRLEQTVCYNVCMCYCSRWFMRFSPSFLSLASQKCKVSVYLSDFAEKPLNLAGTRSNLCGLRKFCSFYTFGHCFLHTMKSHGGSQCLWMSSVFTVWRSSEEKLQWRYLMTTPAFLVLIICSLSWDASFPIMHKQLTRSHFPHYERAIINNYWWLMDYVQWFQLFKKSVILSNRPTAGDRSSSVIQAFLLQWLIET